MVRTIFSVLLLGAWVSEAWAQGIDVNVHGAALRVTYEFATHNGGVGDVGLLRLETNRYARDDFAFHGGYHVGKKNLRIGVRSFYASPGSSDLFSIGFGGQGRVALNHQWGLGGHLYYAPSVTSTIDGEGYLEFLIRLDFQMNSNVYVYAGYRNIAVKIGDAKREIELDNEPLIGMQLYF